MTRTLRAIWRLFRLCLHVVSGVWMVWLRWPSLDAAGRHARIQTWSAKLLRVLGLTLRHQGQFKPGAKLVVANHVSWMDIIAIHAVCPQARFVSKADVQHWPVVGRLVHAAGTLFIERERKRDALRVVHQMAEAMQGGDTVAVFPEGTTGTGQGLMHFHANLFQAAIATSTPVQPVGLRYSERGHPISPSVAWVGETTMAQNLWAIVCADGLQVSLVIQPPHATAHADRRALAEHMQAQVEAAVGRC